MKIYAFYLPQYYPTPENDAHWGKGFTEWHNVASARPLFKGHQQPKLPSDLGFYDLRVPDTIRLQAEYARSYGIDGFAFWHYWFGDGKQTLEKPMRILRENEDIDINYFACWVNADWTMSWRGNDKKIIFKQKYDRSDFEKHYEYMSSFFQDGRYLKIDGRPVYYVYSPLEFSFSDFKAVYDAKAKAEGYGGIHWVAPQLKIGGIEDSFDHFVGYPPGDFDLNTMKSAFKNKYVSHALYRLQKMKQKAGVLQLYDYAAYAEGYESHLRQQAEASRRYIPTIMPNWDNTPRYKKRGWVFHGENHQSIKNLVGAALQVAKSNDLPFILLKAWNEWAEGNMIEPMQDETMSVGAAIREASLEVRGS